MPWLWCIVHACFCSWLAVFNKPSQIIRFTELKSVWAPYECNAAAFTYPHSTLAACTVKTTIPQWPLCATGNSEHDLPSSSSLGLVATHVSLLHWHGCTVVVPFPFILIDGLLPSHRRKTPYVTGHNMASQLSIWLMCAAWIQATALVFEAPSHSPWIHIAAHILLLLWCNCFVIAS